ncbi:hypothetical protein GCM10027298_01560 [Epidermidibacterium keratini]
MQQPSGLGLLEDLFEAGLKERQYAVSQPGDTLLVGIERYHRMAMMGQAHGVHQTQIADTYHRDLPCHVRSRDSRA